MGEKLAMLHLEDNSEDKSNKNLEFALQKKPPSADSVHVLLKQALHADDRALLIDCLYRQDEKVIFQLNYFQGSSICLMFYFLISGMYLDTPGHCKFSLSFKSFRCSQAFTVTLINYPVKVKEICEFRNLDVPFMVFCLKFT